MSGKEDLDYDAVRQRSQRREQRLVPLAFDLFYPLLVAAILVTGARWYGLIDERDLGIRFPQQMQQLMRDAGFR